MTIHYAYVREEWDYPIAEIKRIFKFDNNENDKLKLQNFIKELKAWNIIKSSKSSHSDFDGDYENEDEEVYSEHSDDELVASGKKYKFKFVGIAICQNRIIYAYPKYMGAIEPEDTYEPKEALKQIIKIICKYSYEKKKLKFKDVCMFDDFAESKGKYNMLSVMAFILEDYAQNGDYDKDEEILDLNDCGEVNWTYTIDHIVPVLDNDCPIYLNMYIKKNISDDADYIKRLHRFVVTACSKEIENAKLSEYFSLPYAEVSEDEGLSFGDNEYILERLDSEMATTFDDRKKRVLKSMMAYFKSRKVLVGEEELQLIGTRYFNLVWEWVCARVFESQHDKLITEISPLIDYESLGISVDSNPPTLIDLIEKPVWKKYGDNSSEVYAKKTLEPDSLRFEKDNNENAYIFYILDAKYYCPEWNSVCIKYQPGVQDLIKQYMYHLAYKDIIEKYNVTKVKNYFLMPKREYDVKKTGKAWMKMLRKLGEFNLGEIEVRMLEPYKMFELCLNNEHMNLSELD